ncbi:hypothetical protein ACQFYA_12925 [Promicromonospora sp. Marseille-Q5078]
MTELARPWSPPAPPEPAQVTWRDLGGLVGVALVTYAAVPFVSYAFVGGAFGADGVYALMLVPALVAAVLGAALMRRRGGPGKAFGAAGPLVAFVVCGGYFLATAREPVVAIGFVALAAGPLAAGVAALALPGRWALGGVVVLALVAGGFVVAHRAGESERLDERLDGLVRPYVLDDPDLVLYDAHVGADTADVAYSGPGYSYSVITTRPGGSSDGGDAPTCRADAGRPAVVDAQVRCEATGVPDGWHVSVTANGASEAEVATLASRVVPMSDDDFRRWAR